MKTSSVIAMENVQKRIEDAKWFMEDKIKQAEEEQNKSL